MAHLVEFSQYFGGRAGWLFNTLLFEHNIGRRSWVAHFVVLAQYFGDRAGSVFNTSLF